LDDVKEEKKVSTKKDKWAPPAPVEAKKWTPPDPETKLTNQLGSNKIKTEPKKVEK